MRLLTHVVVKTSSKKFISAKTQSILARVCVLRKKIFGNVIEKDQAIGDSSLDELEDRVGLTLRY